jgi:hypothetical protein
VVESWNGGISVIFFGKGGDMASNRRDEQELSVLCCGYCSRHWCTRTHLADNEWADRMTDVEHRGLTPLFWTYVAPVRRSPAQHTAPSQSAMNCAFLMLSGPSS